MRMKYKLICLLMLAATHAMAQDISQIAKSDPLVMTGTIGTQNTYYHSSVGNGYASPLSNMVFANLNVALYGISMPFSFYYSNDNTSFNYPTIQFSLNPRYKNWTGHFGRGAMAMSPYVMNMSFNGIGVEYDDKRFHTGIFYGILRNAVNDDPTDPFARTPQYKRVGWGFKIGYGTSRNFIDLYLLRAYDRLSSLNEQWREKIAPQENIVVGARGGVSPTDFLSFTVNGAASVFSTDTRADVVETKEAEKWENVFKARYSSLARFAGDVAVNLTLPTVNASLFYRLVQPDYTSLGTYYMSNNYQSFGVNANTFLSQNISLAGTFSLQSDNLTNKQLYTTRGYVYSLAASARILDNLNLAIGYNGYTQNQSDGTAKVNDTTKVDRVTQSFTFTPSYFIDAKHLSHTFALSFCYTDNKDHNRFTAAQGGDIKATAIGGSYDLGVKDWEMDFVVSMNHQVSKGMSTKYTSDVASLTTSRSFFEDKQLNISATLSLCYNEIERQSKSLSMGGDLAMSYTLNKVHLFSLTAGLYKYGDVNQTKRRSSLDATDISASLNYTYTFSLLELKRKAGKGKISR